MGLLKVKPLGAIGEVGRSAILVETEDRRILLDYGIKLRPKQSPLFPPEVEDVDAVLLTHAHLDHSGALPLLFRRKKAPVVYGLDITRDFIELLLYDSIKVAKKRGYQIGYGSQEIKRLMRNFRPIEYGVPFKIGSVEVIPFDAGHIPGSAMYYLRKDGTSLLYTGDFKLRKTRLSRGAERDLPEVDLLITECTYSQREHPSRKGQEKLLREVVKDTINRGGSAIIAGFAIARLNEIAMILSAAGMRNLFLDGMARAGTEILLSYPHRLRDDKEFEFSLRNLRMVENWKVRENIVKRPSVVLTTSGMLEGGPVYFYLERKSEDPISSLTLTGYQIEGTEGRRLLQEGEIYIDGERRTIEMRVNQLDFSSHVGRSGLFEFVRNVTPKQVLPIHGEETDKFGEELRELVGVDVVLPVLEEEINISSS
ncbi:MAG: MBL fold metallo-hydrolase [Thermoproteota archaeon]|nr:MAG: MBL fold metallo-hydrolase [Candidatus Korarchaeota archaeon]